MLLVGLLTGMLLRWWVGAVRCVHHCERVAKALSQIVAGDERRDGGGGGGGGGLGGGRG